MINGRAVVAIHVRSLSRRSEVLGRNSGSIARAETGAPGRFPVEYQQFRDHAGRKVAETGSGSNAIRICN